MSSKVKTKKIADLVQRYEKLFHCREQGFYAFDYQLPHKIDEEGKKRYERHPWFVDNKIKKGEDLTTVNGGTYLQHLRCGLLEKHPRMDGKFYYSQDWGLILPPIDDNDKANFGAIDVDVYKDPKLLKRVVKQIYKEKLPLAPCYSKSKGLHLYLFAQEPVDAEKIVRALKYYNNHLGTNAKEIFPKTTALKIVKGKKQKGNGILLPYKSCLYTPYPTKEDEWELKPVAQELISEDIVTYSICEFIRYAETIKVAPEFFGTIPLDVKIKKETKPKSKKTQSEARPLNEILQKILNNIQKKKEHDRGGTFDNWIVDFVFGAMEENLSNEEILGHCYSVWEFADIHTDQKGIETYQSAEKKDYFIAKIDNCRNRFGKVDPGPRRDKLIKDLIWIMDIQRYWDSSKNKHYPEKSIEARYGELAAKRGTIASWYKRHVDKQDVEEIIYRPDLYKENTPRIKMEDEQWYLNKYKPSGLVPIEPKTHDDLEPFTDLMKYLVPNEKYRGHFLDWLAYIVQNPGMKIKHAVMVYSLHWQIGKGSLFDVMTDILGEDNAEPSNVRAMLDKGVKFAEKQLILIDECKSKGDFGEKSNLINDLKTIISEKRIQQRVLYKDFQVVKTFTNYLIFTNNKDALAIAPDDARYFVLFNEEERLPQSFYKNFHKWRQSKGSAMIYWWLKDRNLSKFDPMQPAPETEFRKEMALEAEHPLTMKIREWIEEGRHPFSLDESVRSSSEITDWISTHCKGDVIKYANNSKTLASSLNACGCKKIGQVLHKRRGDKPTLWIYKNHNALSEMKNIDICNNIWKPIFVGDNAETVREEKKAKEFNNRSTTEFKEEERHFEKNLNLKEAGGHK